MSAIQERVHRALAEGIHYSGVSADHMRPELRLADDLGADSLDMVEAAMAVEEEFGIEIPDDRWEQCETIGDVYQCVEQLLPEGGA